ncbi:protein kinase [Sorangium cellulosum]|uniref:Protein kinase n=1 Tax=Sorangium cellulosum TaxID=56 RepID=A0A2L0EXZ7_SORCE|nr:serine/threonine-protein kinase [Sorangium cellulosum]AUX44184.1 protein kinase [Sorangium cellulosum]
MIAGHQVTSTLRLSRQLGKGAMGSVWVADHLALGTQVAVKFMSPAYAEQGGFVERFRREAMAAAQIKSPHVAQVFDHGVTADGAPYIVMELLEGEDLKRRIERLRVLAPTEVALIVGQTAKALGRAHQLGIIHRDIKPDNIFLLDVDGEPFVKVVDFGVAKRVQGGAAGELGMTSTGSVLGTPLYMSPEQLLSAKHVDYRADLWGLAVVAYHALTGQVPFRGETLGALSVVLHTGIFTPPSALRPELGPAIDAWMKKALQLDPAARFSSARQMADALASAVLGVSHGSFTTEGSSSGDPTRSRPSATPAPAQPVSFGPPPPASTPPGARLSTTGTPGRTLAGMSTSGQGSSRRWAPALVAVALAVGAALSVVVFLVTRGTPVAPVTPTSEEQPLRQTTPAAPPEGAMGVTPSGAVAPAPASATAAVPASAPVPADPAPAAPGPQAGAPAGKPGTIAAPPRSAAETRGSAAPRASATGRTTAPRPPPPVEDTIGF